MTSTTSSRPSVGWRCAPCVEKRLHTDLFSTLDSVHAFVRITVSVNGEEHTREVEPRLLLVHFLRDDAAADRDALGL